jgi:hypothetical protein
MAASISGVSTATSALVANRMVNVIGIASSSRHSAMPQIGAQILHARVGQHDDHHA